MGNKLTFGELELSDKFIVFPIAGDDSGHGGFKGGHYIFYKWKYDEDGQDIFCAKKFSDGVFSMLPDSIEVIKLI